MLRRAGSRLFHTAARRKHFQISLLVFPIWRLDNGSTAGKSGKSDGKGHLFSGAHRNKIPTARHMLAFSMAITFMSLGVAVTPEVDMAAVNRKQHHLELVYID